jgi:hypothetical protein
VLYQDTKQHDKAEVVLRTTLRNAEHALGPTHPHTLTLVFNLGYCLWGQKRDRAAEAFFRRELAGCEATKGPDHRDTQRSRQNLARLIAKQAGREKEAEAILRGETKPAARDGDTSNPGSPTQHHEEGGLPPKKEKRVAISMPEVQQTTPVAGHLVKVAAGLSALPPPRGVGGPRNSSSEWETDPAALPKEAYGAPSPTSDGDDRTGDDTTTADGSYAANEEGQGEEEEEGYYDEEEDVYHEEGEHPLNSEDEYYVDEDDADLVEGNPDAEGSFSGEGNPDAEGSDSGEEEGDEDSPVQHALPKDHSHAAERPKMTVDLGPTHRRLVSKDTVTSILSEDEEVVEYDDTLISDSFRIPEGRGREHSYGRQRREQTVTSDDELLAEQLAGHGEDDDEEGLGSFHEDDELDGSASPRENGHDESSVHEDDDVDASPKRRGEKEKEGEEKGKAEDGSPVQNNNGHGDMHDDK